SNSDWHKRSEAAQALGALGPKAAKADDELLRLLRDPNPVVRYDATNALRLIHASSQPQITCTDLGGCAGIMFDYAVGWMYTTILYICKNVTHAFGNKK